VQLFCRKLDPPVQKTSYFENEGDLKFSGTAKPTDSAALKNWLFLFIFLFGMACKHWQEGPTDAPPAAFSSDGLSCAAESGERGGRELLLLASGPATRYSLLHPSRVEGHGPFDGLWAMAMACCCWLLVVVVVAHRLPTSEDGSGSSSRGLGPRLCLLGEKSENARLGCGLCIRVLY
jgi:hypothetical protein